MKLENLSLEDVALSVWVESLTRVEAYCKMEVVIYSLL